MADIVDAFLVTLGLDAAKFHEAAEKVGLKLTDLKSQAKDTADGMQNEGDRAGEFFGNLITKATQLFAVLAGGQQLMQFVDTTAEADRQLGRLAGYLKMSVVELGAWQHAAYLADGSAEGFRNSIKALAGNLVDIEKRLPRAERSLKVFQAAGIQGIAMGKKSEVLDVLDQIAGRMEKMNPFEAMRLGSRMGLDDGTIRLMMQGRESIAKVRAEMKELGTASEEEVVEAEALEDAQKRLEISNTMVARNMSQVLVPMLTLASKALLIISKWAKENPAIVKAAFITIAFAAGVMAIAAAKAAVAMLVVSWPIVLISAAVMGLIAGITWLIYKYREWDKAGQETKSKLGEFFGYIKSFWDRFGEPITKILGAQFGILIDLLKVAGDAFTLMWSLATGDQAGAERAWENLTKRIGQLIKDMVGLTIYQFATMVIALQDLTAGMATFIGNKLDGIKEKFGWLTYLIPGLNSAMAIKGGWDVAGGMAAGAGRILSGDMSAQQNVASFDYRNGNTSGNKTVDTRIGQINVYTDAQNAEGIAGEMFNEINKLTLTEQADMGMW